jgi:hypothetical protein
VISVHARHVASAETAYATSAEATDVTSAEATDVASAKAAHMASATTTSMSTAAAAATAGLCIRGKKAAGKHRACQDHHYSSSHDILLFGMGGTCRHIALSDAGVSEEDKCRRRDGLKMRMLICRFH